MRWAEEEANSGRQCTGAAPCTPRHPQGPGDGGKAAIGGQQSETAALRRANTTRYRVQVEFGVSDTPERKFEGKKSDICPKYIRLLTQPLIGYV